MQKTTIQCYTNGCFQYIFLQNITHTQQISFIQLCNWTWIEKYSNAFFTIDHPQNNIILFGIFIT